MYTKGLFRVLIPCCDRGLFHKVDKQISVKRNFSLPQTFSVGYCECKVHFFKNCSTEKLWEKLIEKNKTKHRMKWSVKKKYQQPRGEQFTEHKLNPASRENRLQKDHQKAGRCSIFDPWCKFTTGHSCEKHAASSTMGGVILHKVFGLLCCDHIDVAHLTTTT